ncbi:unnamed protein product [Allacma fusca]|uniref:Uncharacterized protein n=1 Tax=Allacma fusca TaxID=39272 RepID=A0A8J2PAR6_9HEXA|nr:unnamed protein product [Allacma fusca]
MLRVLFQLILASFIMSKIRNTVGNLIDGGAYRMQNVASGLYMTTQPSLGGNIRLAYVKTDTWVNSKEQNWGIEFYSNDRTMTPASIRENNVTLETNPGSSFLTSVLYHITPVSSVEYQIKNKKKQLCLIDLAGVVSLSVCEGQSSIWKFYRNG